MKLSTSGFLLTEKEDKAFKALSSPTRAINSFHTLECHLPYLALIFASISGVIVVASLNLALASGVLSLLTVGDPLSIAFSRFLMPQSGFTVKVLLNDSVAIAIPPIFKFIKGNYSLTHLNNTIKAIKPSTIFVLKLQKAVLFHANTYKRTYILALLLSQPSPHYFLETI